MSFAQDESQWVVGTQQQDMTATEIKPQKVGGMTSGLLNFFKKKRSDILPSDKSTHAQQVSDLLGKPMTFVQDDKRQTFGEGTAA